MNKRIRKKKSKRLCEMMQEINVIGLMMGRKTPDNLFLVPDMESVDKKAVRRVQRSLK